MKIVLENSQFYHAKIPFGHYHSVKRVTTEWNEAEKGKHFLYFSNMTSSISFYCSNEPLKQWGKEHENFFQLLFFVFNLFFSAFKRRRKMSFFASFQPLLLYETSGKEKNKEKMYAASEDSTVVIKINVQWQNFLEIPNFSCFQHESLCKQELSRKTSKIKN